MSLLPGILTQAARRTFVSPRLYDEESLALNSRSPSRRLGCAACDWMLPRDHSLCHCEVSDYHNVAAVLPLLRQRSTDDDAPHALAASPPSAPPALRMCARCTAVDCATFRPLACEIRSPALAPPASAHPSQLQRSNALHAAGCDTADARSAARLMSEAECQAVAQREGYGRRWIGASPSPGEARGCVLWEDGNVEFNTAPRPTGEPHKCNVRGTCLCARREATAAELQIVGSLV